MWVIHGVAPFKIYAYSMASKARVLANDITLVAGNTDPQGLWSDGTTMWVADYGDDKLFAYNAWVE